MSANQYGYQLGQALMEAEITQLSFSFEANVSPESVSAYKNGRRPAPPDIKSKSILLTDNPFLAIAAAQESTAGTSPAILDGDRVELNRHTVISRTATEMEELLNAIDSAKKEVIGLPPRALSNQDRQEVEKLIQETLDVITAATNLVAILCREYKLSWIYQWGMHKSKLVKRGFLKMVGGGEVK